MEQISKEDLLLRVVKLKAENTLLRKQLVECGKDKAMIQELEYKLQKRTDDRVIELNARIEKLNQKVENQRITITNLYKKQEKSFG